MTVVQLTIWDIAPADVEAALAQAAEGKKMALANGAEDMRVGQFQTGPNTGKWLASTRYANMEALGKAMDAMAENSEYLALMASVKGTVVSRTIIRGADIG